MTGFAPAVNDGIGGRLLPAEGAFPETVSPDDERDQIT